MKTFPSIPTWFYLSCFVTIALLQVWLVRDTVMGDAFIHFVFARGIAGEHFFFYNGQFSAGSTSPFWSLLLAPFWAWLGDGIIPGVKVLAGFFVGTSVLLAYPVGRALTATRAGGLLTAALTAGSFVLSFWAAKGMETPLFVSLVLASFWTYFTILAAPKQEKWRELWLGALLGLAIFTRPEGWFLAAFLGLPLLWVRGPRVLWTVGFPAFVIFAPYYFYLFQQTGQLFPSSIARVLHAQQFAHATFGVFWTAEVGKILLTKLLPLLPFVAFAVALPYLKRSPIKWPSAAPVTAWLVFHLLFFTFVMPMTQGYRYLLAALPLFYAVAAVGILAVPQRWRLLAAALALGGSFAIAGQQLAEARTKITTCEAPAIDAVRRETGAWLATHTAPSDVIAIKEVDQSAYFSGRQVLSMDGTLDPRAVPYVRAHDQLGFVQKYRPAWLVLEEDMYRLYPAWQTSNLTPLLAHTLKIGETVSLGGTRFTLAHRIRLGDATTCAHFRGEYFWTFWQVNY